jgi:sugar O-acyltransferase (sialic acid O-acetyltransferase NeuD family)
MKLVCFGASNAEDVREIEAVTSRDPRLDFLGFIDDTESKWGTKFYNYPVLGGRDLVHDLKNREVVFCNLIDGNCIDRYETTKFLVDNGCKLINLVHPTVNLEMTHLGVGNYIQENVVLQAEVKVGNNSSIHVGSVVAHESTVGNTVFIAGGCFVSGRVTIEDGAYLGTGVNVAPAVKIGKWSVIGTGAVVVRDVPPYKVIVGNPGIPVNSVEEKYTSGDVL